MPDDAPDASAPNGRPAPEEPVLLALRHRKDKGDEGSSEPAPPPEQEKGADDDDVPL